MTEASAELGDSHRTVGRAIVYRRGLISGWWTAVPVLVGLSTGLVVSMLAMQESRPTYLPFVAALYGCIFFFAHSYSVAWRAGTYLWQYLAMLVAVALLALAAWLHIDDAAARTLYVDGVLVDRPPQNVLFLAVAGDAIAALMLLAHCTVLGFGIRSPRTVAQAPSGAYEALPSGMYDAVAEAAAEAVDDTAEEA